MDYKSKLSENNTELQGVLNDIIALPTYTEGYNDGKTDGYNQCTEDMQDDLQAKYSEGYEDGYEQGEIDGYDVGYSDGYSDGSLAGGGGGGNTEVDAMMLLDEGHEWEGEPPFYSYYKYLYFETSNLSSTPVVLSFENANEFKYLHVYIYAFLNGEREGGNDEEAFYTVVLPPADEAHGWYSFDSLEINSPCYEVKIQGIRWSDDGV